VTKKQKQHVAGVIENEGFDYAFRFYSNFDHIRDERFHKFREAYINAACDLSGYLDLGEEEGI
jgi:hypothetical protein